MRDISEQIALGCHGKTDKANSPVNQNPDFQEGYSFGTTFEGESFDAIRAKWEAIGRPTLLPESFREWKRGFWSARIQKTIVRAELKEHDPEM